MSKPVFEDLFTLSGRRNRQSYFLYSLLMLLILGGIWILAAASGGDGNPLFVVALLVTLAIAVSNCVVGAQRCRDFGWTGWAILLSLVPFVGWIFPLVMFFVPGTAGPNRYGPDPLASGAMAPASL